MKLFSTGGTYINFLTEDEGPDRIKTALGTSRSKPACRVFDGIGLAEFAIIQKAFCTNLPFH